MNENITGTVNPVEAHAQAVVDAALALTGDRLQEHVQLHTLRPVLDTAGLTREEQDAALAWLQRRLPVTTELDGREATVQAHLMPESSARRGQAKWINAAYRVDSATQRADMLYLEPAE